ncbi:hypothetical protein MTO96_023746 [Rhipicephalus appendiculatus]
MARSILGKWKPSALLATAAILGLYYLLLKSSPGDAVATVASSIQSRDGVACSRAFTTRFRVLDCDTSTGGREDASMLIDLVNFTYSLDSPPCGAAAGRGDDDVTLLVVVHSAAANFAERDVIRSTWGAARLSNLTLRVVFMLARRPDDPELEDKMARENLRYGDTVQGNFVDSYRNLTYKHVMALRWASTRCASVARVLKMDDDIFVHVFQLAAILDKASATPSKRKVILCYVQKQMPISRSEGSKWKVTESEYPGSFFEDYCSGWAYLADMAAVRAMVTEAQYRPYFWVDDVHVTGTLARMGGVSLSRINHKYTTEADSLALWAKPGDPRDSGGLLDWGYAFGPTWGDVTLVARAHRKVLWCRRRACKCCFKAVNANAANANAPKNGSIGKAVVHSLSVF